MDAFNKETTKELERITASELSEMEKLVQSFDWTTTRMITFAQNEIDLARALHDREAVVKQQIKMETLKLARSTFETCYLRATGSRSKLWEE